MIVWNVAAYCTLVEPDALMVLFAVPWLSSVRALDRMQAAGAARPCRMGACRLRAASVSELESLHWAAVCVTESASGSIEARLEVRKFSYGSERDIPRRERGGLELVRAVRQRLVPTMSSKGRCRSYKAS